jgi:transcription factor Dp-1
VTSGTDSAAHVALWFRSRSLCASSHCLLMASNNGHRNKRPAEDMHSGDADDNVPSPPKAVKLASTATNRPYLSTTFPVAPVSSSSSDKGYKGLRHFSMMVCKKVEEKGTTTYNEVADELVKAVMDDRRRSAHTTSIAETVPRAPGADTESAEKKSAAANVAPPPSADDKMDEKNIRRRVYDALNVLMAMDIIVKDKKEISWKGLPTSASQDLDGLHRELWYRERAVSQKRETLRELLVQHVCFRNLVALNQSRRGLKKPVGKQGKSGETEDNVIPLPFIVINTSSQAVIQCHMSRDMTDVMFDFSKPFEINDDNTILKRLGL